MISALKSLGLGYVVEIPLIAGAYLEGAKPARAPPKLSKIVATRCQILRLPNSISAGAPP